MENSLQNENKMVVIFEACRSPEIYKSSTEGKILSDYFKLININFELYSNDGIWDNKTILTKHKIKKILEKHNPSIVHIAMHGNRNGLVLEWKNNNNNKYVKNILDIEEISKMKELKGKIIISGACESSALVNSFIEAGAKLMLAPKTAIPWKNLAEFFKIIYKGLNDNEKMEDILNLAIDKYPELHTYCIYQK